MAYLLLNDEQIGTLSKQLEKLPDAKQRKAAQRLLQDTVKQYKEYVTNQPIIMCSKGLEMESLNTLEEIHYYSGFAHIMRTSIIKSSSVSNASSNLQT